MSNDYFRYAANILPGGVARSQPISQTYQAIEKAFDLMPNPIADGQQRGFSQPIQVAPAQDNLHAVTLGQMLAAIEGNESLRDALVQAAEQAAQAQQSSQGIYDSLGRAFSNLGVGSSVVDAQGNVILTYNGELVTDAYLNNQGELIVETEDNKASDDWPHVATVTDTTSAPLYIPNTGVDAGVYVEPTQMAHVEYTFSSKAQVQGGTAEWLAWPLGNVNQPTDDAVSTTITALRLVSTGETTWTVTL